MAGRIINENAEDKNVAESYQESASMQRQVEYARALKGDIAIGLNSKKNATPELISN
ncbi:MAG: hypothetical protein PHS80_01535 [Methanothrix sp.]|nr:hypothetical protein [Methanothrix sp.]MDD4446054.1 hypothetical protein [Methanothrix sp.]